MARREDDREKLAPRGGRAVSRPDDDLPVVARVVVEIRSDGKRTVARGAMEDVTGHGVTIEASGRTPLQLAMSLARTIFTLPAFGRSAARALLLGRGSGRLERAAAAARASAAPTDAIDIDPVEDSGPDAPGGRGSRER